MLTGLRGSLGQSKLINAMQIQHSTAGSLVFTVKRHDAPKATAQKPSTKRSLEEIIREDEHFGFKPAVKRKRAKDLWSSQPSMTTPLSTRQTNHPENIHKEVLGGHHGRGPALCNLHEVNRELLPVTTGNSHICSPTVRGSTSP
ncbi:unnamed protein product [Arctogadus glacialis]